MIIESSRRDFLRCTATGVAAGLLSERLCVAARAGLAHPLAPRATHQTPKAKQLVFVFLTGGFSHVDTFDPKPQLAVDHGKTVSAEDLRNISTQPLLRSPFTFSRQGESGIEISELFPYLGRVADELCVIRSLHTDILEHFQSVLAMHTGSATVPMPSLGSWLSYGLGTLNPNLPPYLVLCEHLPYAGSQVWDSSFLPPEHQGTRIIPGDEPIPNLKSQTKSSTIAELERTLLQDVNEAHAAARAGDPNLRARINSFHTARGMMRVAPELFELSEETSRTLGQYGVKDGDRTSFGWQCLMARRMIERGVRVVELIDSGASGNWDSHGDMQAHRPMAARADQPLSALISDLRQRGLLDETLVVICTEFGRTPWDKGPGRNHWHRAFSSLLVGGGVKGGITYGKTDEYGILPVENPVHVHDYHATILHLLGLDHTELTYRYAGRDFRLTDVSGEVLHEIFT
ncbi:MAG: DUF1501 domain-containing protein [Planctomycetaceae bacterium]|nr:DUF1501 domain-containing protein [Planctomycetaceae bacterium]